METILPKTKVAAKVPRAFAGLKVFISKAMGGPPIDVEVPRKPDSPPAMSVLVTLTLGVQPKELRTMVKMTEQPIKICSELVDNTASAHTARNVPGNRARFEYKTIFQSVSAHARCRVEHAMIKAKHKTTTGTRSGFSNAMMGVDIVPSPKPMTPGTVAPIKMMSPR